MHRTAQRRLLRVGLTIVAVLALGLGTVGAASGADTETSPPAPAGPDDSGRTEPPPLSGAALVTDTENLYVPISPCRIFDTREQAAGDLYNGEQRNFYVRGTSGFAGQGGTSGGCGLPLSAVAATVSLTAVDYTGNGRINAYPYNTTEASATLMTYSANEKTTSNMTVKLTGFGFAPHLRVHNYYYSTDLVGDVTGYYVPQIAAVLNSGDGVYNGTSRVLSNDNTGTGSYAVTIDRDVTGCSVTTGPYSGPYLVTGYASGNTVYAKTYYFAAGVPTLTNMYWQMVVVC